MKKLLSILLLLLLITTANGQTWAPLGATWTFGYQTAFTPYFGYHQWISTKDTLVNSQVCKLLEKISPPAQSDISDKLITYQDSNKVFLYNTHFNQFTVLYDFNKSAGESWTMKIDSCDLLITVDSTGIDTINGFPLKALYIISENWAFTGKVLQYIGHLSAPNPDINFHCYGMLVDGTYYTGLRCYEDTIIGQVNFGIAPDCYYTYSINDIKSNDIGILPNPFCTQTTMQTSHFLKNATLTILNSFGQQIKQIKNIFGNSITLYRDNLPSGLYIIRITQDNKVVGTDKLVIMEN